MDGIAQLSGPEPRSVLANVIEKKIPAIMSYSSKDKWHVAKILLTDMGANTFDIEVSPRKKPHPINIRVEQPVGISIKYGYGKFIFDTSVTDFKPSGNGDGGGRIVLAMPPRIELVQRRNYFRVQVPQSLRVNILMWNRRKGDDNREFTPEQYWQGELVDISAGGAQIVINASYGNQLKKGQFMGVRFTPLPYEMPLMFNVQIRNILPTVDGKDMCLGVQIVGLEASSEGRKILSRLVRVVEQYYQINQSGTKQHDVQRAHAVRR